MSTLLLLHQVGQHFCCVAGKWHGKMAAAVWWVTEKLKADSEFILFDLKGEVSNFSTCFHQKITEFVLWHKRFVFVINFLYWIINGKSLQWLLSQQVFQELLVLGKTFCGYNFLKALMKLCWNYSRFKNLVRCFELNTTSVLFIAFEYVDTP